MLYTCDKMLIFWIGLMGIRYILTRKKCWVESRLAEGALPSWSPPCDGISHFPTSSFFVYIPTYFLLSKLIIGCK